MKPQEFDQVIAEYDASRDAAREADERHQAAARALMAAQCGAHYDPAEQRRAALRSHCTLPAGHKGDHGRYRERTATG